jgi:predicted nucleotidyltransferase component of viral defense system
VKEHLRQLVAREAPAAGYNLAREYLQARLLLGLQRAGAMIPLAFHGGTALRFLYSLPRFSEDLDFALERPGHGFELRRALSLIRGELDREGFVTEVKISDRRVVHGAFVRFPSLPFDLGISPHRTEVLAVKIEVDTRPPAGAGLETTLVRRHFTLHLQHHDRASLLAGKLHALLTRRYTKGRDVFDLFWYLSDPGWPAPNLTLLNAALQQTEWAGPVLDDTSWRVAVRTSLARIDWRRVRSDLRPFVAGAEELDLLTPENLDRLLRR